MSTSGSSDYGRGLSALALLGLAMVPLGQIHLGFGIGGTLVAVAVAVVGVRSGRWVAVRVAVLTLLIALTGLTTLPFGVWAVVALMGLASRRAPWLMPASGWLPTGRPTNATWWLTGLTAAAAGAGLTLWLLSEPTLGDATAVLVELGRRVPLWALLGFAVVFVIVNAATEEIAYRAIAFEAAVDAFPVAGAIVTQAFAFGTLHVAGFPSGLAGVVLTFSYGLALGTIRYLTGGLRFPVLAHMAADATIAILVIAFLMGG